MKQSVQIGAINQGQGMTGEERKLKAALKRVQSDLTTMDPERNSLRTSGGKMSNSKTRRTSIIKRHLERTYLSKEYYAMQGRPDKSYGLPV